MADVTDAITIMAGFGGFTGISAYVRHWRKTPFYVTTKTKGEILEIQIHRRWWRRFPTSARQHDLANWSGTDDTWICTAKISASDPDADEQVIGAVVKAKNLIKDFQRSDNMKQLETMAKKAIKR